MALVTLIALASCSKPGASRARVIALDAVTNLTGDAAHDWIAIAPRLLEAQLSGSRVAHFPAAAQLDAGRFSAYLTSAGDRLRLVCWVSREGWFRKSEWFDFWGARAAGPAPLIEQAAKRLDPSARSLSSRNGAALRAYFAAVTTQDAAIADRALGEAAEADPGFALAWLARLDAAIVRRDGAGPARVLEQMRPHRTKFPAWEQAVIDLHAAEAAGDTASVRAQLARLAAIAPLNASYPRTAGELAFRDHDYVAARTQLGAAIALAGPEAQLLNLFGYAAGFLGRMEEAEKAFRDYRDLRPDDPNSRDSLGDVRFAALRFEAAEKAYRESAAMDPEYASGASLQKAAFARLALGDPAGADKLLTEYLDLISEAAPAAREHRLAEWQYTSGRRKRAASRLEQLAAKAEGQAAARPEASLAWSQLAVWRLEGGNRSAAAEAARRAVDLRVPGQPALFASIASFLTQPSALPAVWESRAGSAFPGDAARPFRDLALAMALLFDQHFAAAEPHWLRFYRQGDSPFVPDAEVLYAWVLLENGKFDAAAKVLGHLPPPPASSLQLFRTLTFPRSFAVRARIVERQQGLAAALPLYRAFAAMTGDETSVFKDAALARSKVK